MSLQKLHDQLHSKLHRQNAAVEITTQQLEDIRAVLDSQQAKAAAGSK